MEFIQIMKESVENSVTGLKLFSTEEEASYHHIFKSQFTTISIEHCKQLENINPIRFSAEPYPIINRPRGQRDIDSVKYHREQIIKNGSTTPIWIAKKGERYIKIDGVHRIAATNLENKSEIPCFIINIEDSSCSPVLDYTDRWLCPPQ